MQLEMPRMEREKVIYPTHDIKLFSGRSNPKLAEEFISILETEDF